MSRNYRDQTKQSRFSSKPFQASQLLPSNYLFSHDKPQFQEEKFNEVSNVEMHSYLQSEVSGHSKQEYEEILANITIKVGVDQGSLSSRKHTRPNFRRIEDHEIIVVEEQNELGSNSGGKESVILQHIDFNSQQRQHQETPEWDNRQSNYKHEGVNYIINCVEAPHFLVQYQDNNYSSTLNDFSTPQMNNNKVRYSKKTCIDRVIDDSRDSSYARNIKSANKSCIAQPSNRSDSSISSKSNSGKNVDIDKILNKWNSYNFPQISYQHLKVNQEATEKRKARSFDMEMEAKYCMSNYQFSNSRIDGVEESSFINNSRENQDKQIQTEPISIQHNKEHEQKITNLQQSVKKYEEAHIKMVSKEKKLQKEILALREKLNIKSTENQNLKSNLDILNQSKNMHCVDQSKRIDNKTQQLQKIINTQNLTMRMFEQKQYVLQNKLLQTASLLQQSIKFQPLTTKSSKMQLFDTFGSQNRSKSTQGDVHEACKAKIQSLQEYIFDIEQSKVGIDLQVKKRLKEATKQLSLQLRKNISEQYRLCLVGIRQQNAKLKEINAVLSSQRKEMIQKWLKRQQDFNEREQKMKKMFNQLAVQQIEADKVHVRCLEKKNTFPIIKHPASLSSKSDAYQFFSSNNSNDQDIVKKDPAPKSDFFSNNFLFLSTKNFSNFSASTNFDCNSSAKIYKEYETLPPRMRFNPIENTGNDYDRMTFGREIKNKVKENDLTSQKADNNELLTINSKIKNLRNQINKELDLIH